MSQVIFDPESTVRGHRTVFYVRGDEDDWSCLWEFDAEQQAYIKERAKADAKSSAIRLGMEVSKLKQQLAEAKAEIKTLKSSNKKLQKTVDKQSVEVTRLQNAQGPLYQDTLKAVQALVHGGEEALTDPAVIKERLQAVIRDKVESRSQMLDLQDENNVLGRRNRDLAMALRDGRAAMQSALTRFTNIANAVNPPEPPALTVDEAVTAAVARASEAVEATAAAAALQAPPTVTRAGLVMDELKQEDAPTVVPKKSTPLGDRIRLIQESLGLEPRKTE